MVIFGIIMAVLGFGGILAVRIWRKKLQARRAAAVSKPNLESIAQMMAARRRDGWYPPEYGWPGVSYPPTSSDRLTRPRRTKTSSSSSSSSNSPDDSNSLLNSIVAAEIVSSVESSHDSSSWGDSSSFSSSSDSSSAPSSDFTSGGDSGGGGASGDW